MQSKDLVSLAEQFGHPLYVYDAEKIEFQYLRLTNAFSKVPTLRINYAMKALSNISIISYLKKTWSRIGYRFYSRGATWFTCRFYS